MTGAHLIQSARCQERPNRSDAARVELGSNELLSDVCGSPRRNDDSGFLSPTNNGGGIAPQRHFDGCQSSPPSDGLCLYENLQVSAISLSYPMDGDRNEFLSTYSSVTEHTGMYMRDELKWFRSIQLLLLTASHP